MSMEARVYTILGYDFTPWRDKMYTDEWAGNEDNDKWYDSYVTGKVQLFTDVASGSHLYFGYILAAGDVDEFDMKKHTLGTVVLLNALVENKLNETGLKIPEKIPPMSIITFVEWV